MNEEHPANEDDRLRRLYEEATQPELLAWMERNPDRARQMTPDEVDELLSLQGTGGPLTSFGVERHVELLERKRRLMQQFHTIAGTEYLDLLEKIMGLIYDKVQPYADRREPALGAGLPIPSHRLTAGLLIRSEKTLGSPAQRETFGEASGEVGRPGRTQSGSSRTSNSPRRLNLEAKPFPFPFPPFRLSSAADKQGGYFVGSTIWQRLVHGARRLRQRPDWPQFAGPDWPDHIMAVPVTDRFHAKQGRSIGRLVLEKGERRLVVYLKRHYRLPWWHGLLATLRRGASWSPAMQEWEHLQWARAQGMPVPSAVASGEYIGPWGRLQSFLAVEELTGMLPLHEAIPAAARSLDSVTFRSWKTSLIAEMARLTRALHARRWFHKDLYLCHFYIGEENTRRVPSWPRPGATDRPAPSRAPPVDLARLASEGPRSASLLLANPRRRRARPAALLASLLRQGRRPPVAAPLGTLEGRQVRAA